MEKNIYKFISHVVNNLFLLHEYQEGEIKALMAKFKEEADDLNIEITDAELRKYIERFDILKNSSKVEDKNLRNWPLSKFIKLITSSEGAEVEEETGPDVIYSGDSITVYSGGNEELCQRHRNEVPWCVTKNSFGNYRYVESRKFPSFYLIKNDTEEYRDDEKLAFVAIQVRNTTDESEKYIWTPKDNKPNESRPMSWSQLTSDIPWLDNIPGVKGMLKYVPLSTTEKVNFVFSKKAISIRQWVSLPFAAKKIYLIVRKDESDLFNDISKDEFAANYLPKYPQLATFIATTAGIIPSNLLLRNLDKFKDNDRKSIIANLHTYVNTNELSKENFSFAVKKLLVALNKWDLKSNERLYVTKDGNAIVKLTFGDDVKVGVFTAEDDYPNIKLNTRTSKYLLDYPDIDKIPFNTLIKLTNDNIVDKSFIESIIVKAEEDPNSAIIVKDTNTGKLILDSNSFTSYKLEGGKISLIPFDSEEVQNALSDETENSGFQENAVNIVFSGEDQIPPQIDKDAFYRILNSTPYTNRTRYEEVVLVNPENNKIFSMLVNPTTTPTDGLNLMYGGSNNNNWRNRVNRYNSSLNLSDWRIYFDYLRNQNRSYTSEQLIELINNLNLESAKNVIDANLPMTDNSRIRPAVIDGKYVLINTQDPRNSQTLGRRGNLIRASIPPNVAARALGGQAVAEPAAAPAAGGRRDRPAGAAPAQAAAGEANADVTAAIENAGLTAGFNMLSPSVRTRITAGTVVPYTRRNAALDAVGRVTTLISSGSCKFYIIRLPSGTIIGFATQNLPLPIYHAIVTTNRAYAVPRVREFANTIQQNGINESLKTLIRLHSVAMPEEAKQMREILLKLKNKKK